MIKQDHPGQYMLFAFPISISLCNVHCQYFPCSSMVISIYFEYGFVETIKASAEQHLNNWYGHVMPNSTYPYADVQERLVLRVQGLIYNAMLMDKVTPLLLRLPYFLRIKIFL